MSEPHRPYAGGSVPENYERCLVPLPFLDYAAALVSQLEVPAGGAVLGNRMRYRCGHEAFASGLPEDVQLTATDLAPPMIDQARQIAGEHASRTARPTPPTCRLRRSSCAKSGTS